MELTVECKVQYLNDIDPFDHRATVPEPVRPSPYVFLTNVPLCYQLDNVKRLLQAPHKSSDCALQLCKSTAGQLEFLSYLDLEQTLNDQQEELDEYKNNRRSVIILRTQLTIRVQCCLEKLSNASAADLKKYLFALKQLLQDDKDFVHEFVDSQGLDCLIRICQQAEANSIYYVLKALGQLMLYVDGMNGVIRHNRTVQWLYTLIILQPRLVVKLTLKLLLVFLEYNDTNWQLLTQAINSEDAETGSKPWGNFMKLVNDDMSIDVEVLVYAMTLINKTLTAVPDQDTFYDITDSLEEQGIENFMKLYRASKKDEKDLLEQFDMYDSLVSVEDGDISPMSFDTGFRKLQKVRSSEDIKRTRRRSADVASSPTPSNKFTPQIQSNFLTVSRGLHREDVTQSSPSIPELLTEEHNSNTNDVSGDDEVVCNRSIVSSISNGALQAKLHSKEAVGINQSTFSCNYVQNEEDNDDSQLHSSTVSLPERQSSSQQIARQSMSRRQRRQRQQSHMMEMVSCPQSERAEHPNQDEIISGGGGRSDDEKTQKSELPKINITNDLDEVFQVPKRSDVLAFPSATAVPKTDEETKTSEKPESKPNQVQVKAVETRLVSKPSCEVEPVPVHNIPEGKCSAEARKASEAMFEEQSKLNLAKMGKHMSLDEAKPAALEDEDLASKVCAAKSKLKSTKMPIKKHDSGPPSSTCKLSARPSLKLPNKAPDARQDAIGWHVLEKEILKLPLRIKDADFTDLTEVDDQDYLSNHSKTSLDALNAQPGSVGSSVDPAAPPAPPLPPPLPGSAGQLLPAPHLLSLSAPPPPPMPPSLDAQKVGTIQKKKMKLHWREANSHFTTPMGKPSGTIWEELRKEIGDVRIDKVKFETLFEIRTQEAKPRKLDLTKKELSILDQKRSNAINIGMVHLPKPGAIKTAILSMDNAVLSREDIEKILVGMMPTEEEKTKIIEAQSVNGLQLGTAEQFLLTMGSISELESRLRLWIYKMDYDTIESEICDPLLDMKKGMEELKRCRTFKFILSTLLSIGNFLNNSQVSGFTLDYLLRVTEVKDNVYKHTLLHHLVNLILDSFPDSSDLYSEIGSIIRCAKVDWEDLKEKLLKLEADCDSSVEHLRSIVKHDSTFQLKHKMQETLNDFAKRIVLVKIVYRRVINRFKKFLLWLGYTAEEARTVTVNQLCQAVSEFALEYRTTREKVMTTRQKKANMRERKKTRGVMIVQTKKFVTKAKMLPTLGEDGGGELETLLQNGSTLNPTKVRNRKSIDTKAFQQSISDSKSVIGDSELSTNKPTKSEAEIRGDVKEAEQIPVTPTPSDSPDDDLLEAVLRSVTSSNEQKTRERRRARNVERKSLRRTLKSGLTTDEVAMISKLSQLL